MGCGVSVDTGQSAALDYTCGVVGYSGGGRAVVGHSSQNTSYTDNHNVVALSSPACSTIASVVHHGRVVQLSSSYHITKALTCSSLVIVKMFVLCVSEMNQELK